MPKYYSFKVCGYFCILHLNAFWKLCMFMQVIQN